MKHGQSELVSVKVDGQGEAGMHSIVYYTAYYICCMHTLPLAALFLRARSLHSAQQGAPALTAGTGNGVHSNGSAGGAAARGRPFRRWRPGAWDKLRHWVLTDYFIVSLQLAFGQFIVCLFVFVPGLAFPQACLASVFLYVGIILRQDLHVASYLASSVKVLGAIVSGSTLAGVVVRARAAALVPASARPPRTRGQSGRPLQLCAQQRAAGSGRAPLDLRWPGGLQDVRRTVQRAATHAERCGKLQSAASCRPGGTALSLGARCGERGRRARAADAGAPAADAAPLLALPVCVPGRAHRQHRPRVHRCGHGHRDGCGPALLCSVFLWDGARRRSWRRLYDPSAC